MKGRLKLILSLAAWTSAILFLVSCGNSQPDFSSETLPSTPPSTVDPPTSDPPAIDPPPSEPPVVSEALLDPKVLASAASFLAAASGKETPITIDHVAFVNSVLGLNDVPREANDLFGDLWVLHRDAYGVPITHTVEFDGLQFECEVPVASGPLPVFVAEADGRCEQQVDDQGNPLDLGTDGVPMIVEAYKNGEYKCAVDPCYLDYTQEFDIGRLNMVRSSVQNPDVMARAFAEAMKNINAASLVTLDLAGRLVMTATTNVLNAETGATESVTTTATIDSPRENLALYLALLRYGRLAGDGIETRGEEGEIIPAPWLEIAPEVKLGLQGELEYLRSGTPGRNLDHGVDRRNNYVDLSAAIHDSRGEYHGIPIDYVQYQDLAADPAPACEFVDEQADLWTRVLAQGEFSGNNIAAFTRHADDARKIILFTHEVIQGLPENNEIPALPLLAQLERHDLEMVTELQTEGGADRHLLLETAAGLLGGAAGKESPISIDAVVFVNTLLGLNDAAATAEKGDLFGDLWVLNRDADGAPIMQTIDLGDRQFQCVEPLAAAPLPDLMLQADGRCIQPIDAEGNLLFLTTAIVPMIVEEYMNGDFKCAVAPCYTGYVQEFEMGRLNIVRTMLSNPNVLNHQLVEAMNDLNTSTQIKPDLAGRLVYTVSFVDAEGNEQTIDKTIDSPLQNLALYAALLRWGKLEGEVTVKVEGKEEVIALALDPEVDLAGSGLQFLRDGVAAFHGLGRHGTGNATGYSDFSWFNHCSQADFAGVPIDYVQWHAPDANGCSYTSMQDDLWMHVLGAENRCENNIAAFARQADQVRQVVLFTHDIIQGLP